MGTYVRLLGPPAVRTAAGWTTLPQGKTSGVLAYLAFHADWVRRSELLFRFWPDTDDERARRNLRPLLTKLRRLPFVDRLDSDGDLLRWRVRTDVQLFHRALDAGRSDRACAAYRGPLLQGFHVTAAPEFDTWLDLTRTALHDAWRGAVLRTADELQRAGALSDAHRLLKWLLGADPLDEDALRRTMHVAAHLGDRRAALLAFRAFERTLRDEMALEPEAATRELAQRIENGTPPALPTAPSDAVRRATDRPARLPRPTTPFVGREDDLERIHASLRDPTCRLLTLVGPGGIGKTRLAIQAAATVGEPFADSTRFVPAERATSVSDLTTMLLAAFGYRSLPAPASQDDALEYLSQERALVVLDNLEHLAPDDGFLDALLAACPDITVLATSRRRLDARSEWVYDVAGLRLPTVPTASDDTSASDAPSRDDLGASDAVALFVQAARRARNDVRFDATQLRAVARLCRGVEGMPLAIELAAGWVRLLTPLEIAERVADDLALLDGSEHPADARSGGLRAVFERSWALLGREQRDALTRLAVFPAGFTLDDAASLFGVRLRTLLALVDASLLRRDAGGGRFDLHPVVRHEVIELARDDAEAWRSARDRHASHFLALAARYDVPDLLRAGRDHTDALMASIDDLEAAWRHAVDTDRIALLEGAVGSVGWTLFARGDHERGRRLVDEALVRVPSGTVLYARLLVNAAQFAQLGTPPSARIALLERGVAVLDRLGADAHLAFALRCLGTLRTRSEADGAGAARHCFRRALALYRDLDDDEGVAMMLNNLAYHAPDGNAAERLLGEALDRARRAGSVRALAHVTDTLAEMLSYLRGEHRRAADRQLEAVALMARSGDAYTHALLRLRLARLLVRGGAVDAAARVANGAVRDAPPWDRRVRRMVHGESQGVLADVAASRGDAEGALRSCQLASVDVEDAKRVASRDHLYVTAVRASLHLGSVTHARAWLERLDAAVADRPPANRFEADEARLVAAVLRTTLHLAEGRVDACARGLDAVQRRARRSGFVPARLACMSARALLARRCGRPARAQRLERIVGRHPATLPWDRAPTALAAALEAQEART